MKTLLLALPLLLPLLQEAPERRIHVAVQGATQYHDYAAIRKAVSDKIPGATGHWWIPEGRVLLVVHAHRQGLFRVGEVVELLAAASEQVKEKLKLKAEYTLDEGATSIAGKLRFWGTGTTDRATLERIFSAAPTVITSVDPTEEGWIAAGDFPARATLAGLRKGLAGASLSLKDAELPEPACPAAKFACALGCSRATAAGMCPECGQQLNPIPEPEQPKGGCCGK